MKIVGSLAAQAEGKVMVDCDVDVAKNEIVRKENLW